MLVIRTVVALLFFALIGSARKQYITFWTGTNFTGDEITFRSRHPDTPYYQDFIQHVKSFSCLGYWRVFTGVNYTGNVLDMCSWNDFENPDISIMAAYNGSIRYAGNLDMSGQGIWLFSEVWLLGEERIITTPAANDISFTPKSLLTTGYSNWTLFTGENFDGVSTCLVSTLWEVEYIYILNETLSNIQSVVRGCQGRIDKYVFGDDQNKEVNLETNKNTLR